MYVCTLCGIYISIKFTTAARRISRSPVFPYRFLPHASLYRWACWGWSRLWSPSNRDASWIPRKSWSVLCLAVDFSETNVLLEWRLLEHINTHKRINIFMRSSRVIAEKRFRRWGDLWVLLRGEIVLERPLGIFPFPFFPVIRTYKY